MRYVAIKLAIYMANLIFSMHVVRHLFLTLQHRKRETIGAVEVV